MRHDLSGTINHDGQRYTYSAIIWTGDEAERGDEIAAIEPQNYDIDTLLDNDKLWDELAELALDDANERILYVN